MAKFNASFTLSDEAGRIIEMIPRRSKSGFVSAAIVEKYARESSLKVEKISEALKRKAYQERCYLCPETRYLFSYGPVRLCKAHHDSTNQGQGDFFSLNLDWEEFQKNGGIDENDQPTNLGPAPK